MSRTSAVLGLVAVAGALALCDLCGEPSSPGSRARFALASTAHAMSAPARVESVPDSQTVTLRVDGMTCGGCVIGVRKVLERLDGVHKADVSYEQKRAVVTFDPGKVKVDQMIAAIKTLGYRAEVVRA